MPEASSLPIPPSHSSFIFPEASSSYKFNHTTITNIFFQVTIADTTCRGFIPLKNSCDDDAKVEIVANEKDNCDKKNWLSSTHLWNTNENLETSFQNLLLFSESIPQHQPIQDQRFIRTYRTVANIVLGDEMAFQVLKLSHRLKVKDRVDDKKRHTMKLSPILEVLQIGIKAKVIENWIVFKT
ncbi:hypothetical protein Tco_0494642 [Tanacetum coccineum]